MSVPYERSIEYFRRLIDKDGKTKCYVLIRLLNDVN